jgi:hypothetical protein
MTNVTIWTMLVPKRNKNTEILAITESMMYYLGRKDTVLIS